MKIKENINDWRYRRCYLVRVDMSKNLVPEFVRGTRKHGFNWLQILWGLDIFFNGMPLIKTMVVTNIVLWALFKAIG